MRKDFIWLVAWKELISTWRDSRTLSSTILVPMILIPLFMVGLPLLMGTLFGGEQVKRQKLGVVGMAYLPSSLKEMLVKDQKQGDTVISSGLDIISVSNPIQSVQDGTVEAVIVIEKDLPKVAGNQPVKLKIYSKLGNMKSNSGVVGKTTTALNIYNQGLVARKLTEVGLDTQVLTPIIPDMIDASTKEEKRSGQLAFLIPLFMIQFILAGGQPTAIDSTAGEKERGTLEVLLVSPVQRLEVVLGKFLATVIFSLMGAVFSVVGITLSGMAANYFIPKLLSKDASGLELANIFSVKIPIDISSLSMLLLVAMSMALVVSMLQLAISIFAKSFKEAQTYLMPVTLIITMSALPFQFSDFINFAAIHYSIPVYGSMIAVLNIVRGNLDFGYIAISVVSNIITCAIFLIVAWQSFKRESVIFRN